MDGYLEQLKGKKVEVDCGGILYKGVLVDILENEILLSDQTQLYTLSFDGVSSIVEAASSAG